MLKIVVSTILMTAIIASYGTAQAQYYHPKNYIQRYQQSKKQVTGRGECKLVPAGCFCQVKDEGFCCVKFMCWGTHSYN
jgi:hypothetical protein